MEIASFKLKSQLQLKSDDMAARFTFRAATRRRQPGAGNHADDDDFSFDAIVFFVIPSNESQKINAFLEKNHSF